MGRLSEAVEGSESDRPKKLVLPRVLHEQLSEESLPVKPLSGCGGRLWPCGPGRFPTRKSQPSISIERAAAWSGVANIRSRGCKCAGVRTRSFFGVIRTNGAFCDERCLRGSDYLTRTGHRGTAVYELSQPSRSACINARQPCRAPNIGRPHKTSRTCACRAEPIKSSTRRKGSKTRVTPSALAHSPTSNLPLQALASSPQNTGRPLDRRHRLFAVQ
jgi:hypothetical protein